MQQSIRIRVTGKVQGVFYRQSTKEEALRAGIKGEVRNCSDGSVQIVATGTLEQLQGLVNWCRLGPPRAKVHHVATEQIALCTFETFSVIR